MKGNYEEFVRGVMYALASELLFTMAQEPAERRLNWLARRLFQQQFSAREAAFKELHNALCPGCPGEDHEGCAAGPVHELHASDLRLEESLSRTFSSSPANTEEVSS